MNNQDQTESAQTTEEIFLTLDDALVPSFQSDVHGPRHDYIGFTDERRARRIGFTVPAEHTHAVLAALRLASAAKGKRDPNATPAKSNSADPMPPIVTRDGIGWNEFADRLDALFPQGNNRDFSGSIECLNLLGADVDGTLGYFRSRGATCDEEVMGLIHLPPSLPFSEWKKGML